MKLLRLKLALPTRIASTHHSVWWSEPWIPTEGTKNPMKGGVGSEAPTNKRGSGGWAKPPSG